MSAQGMRPLPAMTPVNAGYFDGLNEGEFRLQSCSRCDHRWFPPSAHCPNCLSDTWEWLEASGFGRLWSWIVMHRDYFPNVSAFQTPYQVAVIKLDEGPLMVSELIGLADEPPKCDVRVRVAVESIGEGHALPFFRTVE